MVHSNKTVNTITVVINHYKILIHMTRILTREREIIIYIYIYIYDFEKDNISLLPCASFYVLLKISPQLQMISAVGGASDT